MSEAHRCPLCGSVDVHDAGLASFQMLSASRCKTCGTHWRSSWSPGAAIASVLVGGFFAVFGFLAVLSVGGHVLSNFAALGFLGTATGLLAWVISLTFLILGCRAAWAGVTELASLGHTPRILKRGKVPSDSPQERTGEDGR